MTGADPTTGRRGSAVRHPRHCVGLGRIDTDGSRANLLADDHPLRGIARPIPLGRTGTSDDVVDAR
ncbi:hypothetical protein [Streptomyces olivaceoviridis]|uniref:hypothetical protein n=1 Tax=Streptomyces olivaceoviridis TaxID=1921 RepID=UPI003316FA39